jgi:hypothetical protein
LRITNHYLQLRVLGLGLLQDGDVGVGVFPEIREILISSVPSISCLTSGASLGLRQPHPTHKVGEAGIGMQARPERVYRKKRHAA